MQYFKLFFAWFICLFASFCLCASPEESAQKLAAAVGGGNRDAALRLCSPGIRTRDLWQNLQKEQENLRKFVSGSLKKQQQFRDYTLLFYQTEKSSGEMILTFAPDGRLAMLPIMLSKPLPDLTKEKMYEDFDFLTKKLADIYPYDEINKQLFQLDYRQVLASYRKKIDKVASMPEFAVLIADALNDCKGRHLWLKDVLDSTSSRAAYEKFSSATVAKDAPEPNAALLKLSRLGRTFPPLILKYFRGAYYNLLPFSWNGKEFPSGMKLLKVNDEPVETILPRLQSRLTSYDLENKQFFGQRFTEVKDNFYLLCDNARELTFQVGEGETVSVDLTRFRRNMQKRVGPNVVAMPKNVFYFAEQKVLYIRVPAMDVSQLEFYRQEIIAKGKGRKVRAVVLDVRGNGGGSDRVWMTILSLLIDRRCSFESVFAVPDSKTALNYLKVRRELSTGRTMANASIADLGLARKTIPYLKKSKFLVETRWRGLSPAAGSLRLNCPIYVIAHDIYSSTGGLLATAGMIDFMYTVGLPSAEPLGQGLDPMLLSLPHSKLIFSCSANVDLSGCYKTLDALHLQVEHEVKLSSEAFFRYLNTPRPDNPAEFLLKDDPFFRRVLELMK